MKEAMKVGGMENFSSVFGIKTQEGVQLNILLFIRISVVFFFCCRKLNPFKGIHSQSTAIAFSPYGRRTSFHVHKRKGIGKSLQSFRPIPKANEKNAAMSD